MASRQLTGLDLAAATYIRTRAAADKLTQTDLAERSGIPKSTLSRYWNGDRSMSLGDLSALINALGDDLADALVKIDGLRSDSEQDA